MTDKNGNVVMLDPRRNQTIERKKLFEEMLLREMPGTTRTNEPMHAVLEGELGESEMVEGREAQNVRNHALIHYLATLANSNSTKDTFDFDFVESLLQNGADINSTDKTGQSVFHEVARSWNIDVATFLIEHGANVNQQDQYGRSPLHVAAAVDYAEMVEFLLQNGADIDIKTSGEGQTAIHFAAKNDAVNSLQMLLGYGANVDARDSKNRTPLQVSAEMNRSKAAKLLIAEGAPAGVYDNLGNSALSLLIEKIPEVALDAMDQFHSVDTINRKEFYFLNYLEGTKLKEEKTPARTPLEIAVQNERYDIIMHPIMQRLIGVKWHMYGKWGAIFDLAINLVYTILWTVLAVTLPLYGRDLYLPLAEHSWRLVIGILLILFTILEIRKQIVNTLITRNELKKWREWRAAELERDLAYCHPRWPQEDQYLRAEIKAVRNLSLISGSDWWIYFDWAALVLILATIASHVTFFHFSNDISKKIHHYIIIPLLIILWFRIFKYARPFEGAGPFVVIFGHVLGDIVKWGFLNFIIVIPFTCAFWITFGAISLTPVQGYDNVGPLLYNIFSMMVVNDHNYEVLETANPVMARLLCGAFIGIAAIVTLNLLIALLSNTFERLYENAVANAVMQRARTILLLQKSLRKKQKRKYYDFIKTKGSPEVIVKTLGRLLMMDGDDHATIERVRDDVKVIVNILGEKFGRKFGKGKKSDLDFVKMDVSKVRRFQEELILEVKNMKQSLQEITEKIEEIKVKSRNNDNINTNNNNNGTETNNNNNTEDNVNNKSMKNKNKTVVTPFSKKISSNTSSLKGKKDLKPRLRKLSDKSSKEDSETESSESETESESSAKNNGYSESIKSKRKDGEHKSRKKSSIFKYSSHKRKKRKKQRIKGERKKSHVNSQNERNSINQQLAYPPTADFRKQDTEYAEFAHLGAQGYPANHYLHNQTNYLSPQSQGTPFNVAYNQVPQEIHQWFKPITKRSGHQRQNPYLQQSQDFIQRFDNREMPTSFDQMHSSPYGRQPLVVRNQLQQPMTLQDAKESYGYQNYGFQSIDQNARKGMPSEYNDNLLAQNIPVIQNKDGQAKLIRPITSSIPRDTIRAHSTPFNTTQIISPQYQRSKNETWHPSQAMLSSANVRAHGNPQQLKKQGVDFPSTLHPPNKSTSPVDNLEPRVDIQLEAGKHQASRLPKVFAEEIPHVPTQVRGRQEEERAADLVDSSFQPEIATRETTTAYPVRKEPEDAVINAESTTQKQAGNDAVPLEIPMNGNLMAPSPTNESNQYRNQPSPAPEFLEKVVYFQGRIDESQSTVNNTQQNQTEMSSGVPISTVSSNDAPYNTELVMDKPTEEVSENTWEFPAPPDGLTAESEFVTDDLVNNPQDIVKYQAGGGTASENTSMILQGTIIDQIQNPPQEIQPDDDNETHEATSHHHTGNTDKQQSEEIKV